VAANAPRKRVQTILAESGAALLLLSPGVCRHHSFTVLQGFHHQEGNVQVTARRPQIKDFDGLGIPDRSLVNYEKYSPFIGVTTFKHTLALQATRGCPYNCAYCHKIWPKSHIMRSVESIMGEIRLYYQMGVRRFAFIDDIFNLDKKNSTGVFESIIKEGLDIQVFFPNGLRGDILTPDYIDLAVEAGTTSIAVSLETASPRLQKLIGKNIKLERLQENINYICAKYPHIILELQAMHGFPSETEKEAMMTVDFIKGLKWIHFPYFHILKIYPNTDMALLAIKSGISQKAIEDSANLAFHELPDTLPFDKHFTLNCQSEFLNRYFLDRERLLAVLPLQLKALTADELVQKYDSYLPVAIHSLADLFKFLNITEAELTGQNGKNPVAATPASAATPAKDTFAVPGLYQKMKTYFPAPQPQENALRILLLDLSQYFSAEAAMLYDVIEPPLGLMYLLTALNKKFGSRINGKIAKSRIDFDSYHELKTLVAEFKPDVIGLRTLTFFKDFFHIVISRIREWGFHGPVVSGGPYATSDYLSLLQDKNVDVVVLGEGEETFTELIGKIMEHGGGLPAPGDLAAIPGIAFVPGKFSDKNGEIARGQLSRELILLDSIAAWPDTHTNLAPSHFENSSVGDASLAYVIFTSGSTGQPKGVMLNHHNVVNLVAGLDRNIYRQYREYRGHLNVALVAPYVFDASVQQIFAVLSLGHSLWIVPEAVRSDGGALKEFYRRYGIDVSDGTPTHLRLMVEEGGFDFHLKHFIIGGEALPRQLVEDFLNLFQVPVARILKITNVYGPTECCVDSTCFEISRESLAKIQVIPIGVPMPNEQILILNKQNQVQPIGIPGELCISGEGVGRGYLNKPELTAEKFRMKEINKSFFRGLRGAAFSKKAPLIYKTGDLARWLPAGPPAGGGSGGVSEFLGRIDQQVKIRGFRIAVEAIDNCLLKYEGPQARFHHAAAAVEKAEIVYCARCVLPATYPGIHFDEEGICNFCREYETLKQKTENYFKTVADFQELTAKIKAAKKCDYDCLLLFSGGKDSSYVLYRLVEMGLKVLAFTFDNGYISETAFANIRRITARLDVDSIVYRAPKMKEIFVESLHQDYTVCNGCFKALTTISTQIAVEKNINMVITGLSRGQIFDTKLQGLYSQGITGAAEIEEKLLLFRKMYHSGADKMSRLLDAPHFKDEVFQDIHFVDFFRYDDSSVDEIKTYLKTRDSYWLQPGDTGFCSTNCIINDVGIYTHTRAKGFHNYAAPLSWSCRLGKLDRDEALAELAFEPDEAKVNTILHELGYFDRPIKAACVVDLEDKQGDKFLCAYIVPGKMGSLEDAPGSKELKEHLARLLPEYMIPLFFVPVEKIPLTLNGKVDRKALPNPVIKVDGRYIAPRGPVEEKLLEIWHHVLGIEEKIGIADNFFELGGYSLKATELVARIHKVFA
ncbi:MAG: AMP-binding protein, partial [Acidobacteria bacterium]|nr:AMP-binding protein [Acidobacteriota bacterium]